MARKIILKEDGLTGSTNAPSGYRYVGYNGSIPAEKYGATVSPIGGIGIYLARFTTNGTNNPSVSVFQNTTGQDLTWTRVSTGVYRAFVSGSNDNANLNWFIGDTNWFTYNPVLSATGSTIGIYDWASSSGSDGAYMDIRLFTPTGTPTDTMLLASVALNITLYKKY